jgi:dienelactone hydrolase
MIRNLGVTSVFVWIVLVTSLWSPARAADYTKQDADIPFVDADGRTSQLHTQILIPEGRARSPLAVVSHGSPRRGSARATMSPDSFSDMGQWLVDRGYAVAIPMRRGYGKSAGPWVEGPGPCQNPDYVRSGHVSAQDLDAVIRYMRQQRYVDANRIVLIGHSAGGWASLADASESPPGVVAAILFAPGLGSFATDSVCGGDALPNAAAVFGKTTHIPTLWLYAENDHFFNPDMAHKTYDAFLSTSHSPARFVEKPECGKDGHMMVRRCPDAWHSDVADFLRQVVGQD